MSVVLSLRQRNQYSHCGSILTGSLDKARRSRRIVQPINIEVRVGNEYELSYRKEKCLPISI